MEVLPRGILFYCVKGFVKLVRNVPGRFWSSSNKPCCSCVGTGGRMRFRTDAGISNGARSVNVVELAPANGRLV